jgi:hypothetical protein
MFSLRSSVSKGYLPLKEMISPYTDAGEANPLIRGTVHSDEASSEAGMEDVEKNSLRKTADPEECAFGLNKIIVAINIAVLAISVGVGSWSYVSLMRLKGNVNNALMKETSFYCTHTQMRNF